MHKVMNLVLSLLVVVFLTGMGTTDTTREMRDTDRVISFSGPMPTLPEEVAEVVPQVSSGLDQKVYDFIKHTGEVTYTKRDMVEFIQRVNYNVSDNDALVIVNAVLDASDQYGMSPSVILGLIAVESDFRHNVVSNKGAVGLMQVLPRVWLSKSNDARLQLVDIAHSERQLFDVARNIRAGTYVLAHYRDIAIEAGETDPIDYALTRYLGGKVNNHSTKTKTAMKDFVDTLT